MSKDEQIVSFGSSNIYRSDLELLNRGQWLNDRILTFISEYLMNLKTDSVYIFSPCETEMIKMAPNKGYVEEIFGSIGLENRDNILFVLNDNENTEVANCGTHWSLLAFNRTNNLFAHFDPLPNPSIKNAEWAKRVHENMKRLVGGEAAELKEMSCPKQTNYYDCGLYVAEFMNDIVKNGNLENIGNLDSETISSNRDYWKNVILQFSN